MQGLFPNSHILSGNCVVTGENVCPIAHKKLVSIRHRTDHGLIRSRQPKTFDRGLALVDVAATRTSPLFAQAEKAFDTVRAILPSISDLSEGDRLHLESRLKELRSRLDQVATFARVERYTASVAS